MELSDAEKKKLIGKEIKERYKLTICIEHAMSNGIEAQSRAQDILASISARYDYNLTESEEKAMIREVCDDRAYTFTY